ncbi:hypothetical protein ABT336_06880 [Micromonospora sp. NPDC000207]|uniref:hypothetical protein n=1 Tax=Micromonospora sp. NPDC000207 TaxID=3154246 RepID=UPI0033345CF2
MHAHDEKLDRDGVRIGRAVQPVQVRNPGGRGVRRDEGAYLRSDLPVAGFMVIEADSIDDAIALVADTPCAVADGVVEVWPIERSPGR